MNLPGGEQLAASIRNATANAATSAIEGFGAAAALALSDVALSVMREGATTGAGTAADSLVTAYATDLVGRIVTDVDAHGLRIGEVQVSTQLAKFASGDPQVTSPVGSVSVAHKVPFAIGSSGALKASGTLTLHATCALDAAKNELEPSAWGTIELLLSWSTEPKKTAAGP
jgi:hypothetical protein